ncbi:MAG: hypothetical protein ACLFS7_02890 [Desulfosudaceae bacterium]
MKCCVIPMADERFRSSLMKARYPLVSGAGPEVFDFSGRAPESILTRQKIYHDRKEASGAEAIAAPRLAYRPAVVNTGWYGLPGTSPFMSGPPENRFPLNRRKTLWSNST